MLRFIRSGSKHTKTIWWILIVVTVVTFLGGFVFLFGAGLDSSYRARVSGAVGTVDGMPISRTEYQNAFEEQQAAYKRQYGTEPGERDLEAIKSQTWRSLIAQRLMMRQARSLGLKPTDHEIVLAMETSPPTLVTTLPVFQTDGKFDPKKYQAALRDPNANWAPFEDVTRQQLPIRKLQERLLSSIKIGQPELREAFRDRFERLTATIVQVSPSTEGNPPSPSEAELDRVYQKYKSRFTTGPRSQLEVLLVPMKFTDEDVRAARDLAQSIASRARAGEDFGALARSYSEGPGAAQGGAIDRDFQPSEFGAEMAPKIAALDSGGVVDPVRDGGRFLVFQVRHKTPNPATGVPTLRVAQIVIRVKPNDDALQQQGRELLALRNQGAKVGLGRAAAARGLATSNTGYYDYNNPPPSLFGVPDAYDWGLNAKVGSVSPVFRGIDEFAIVQSAKQSPGGPAPRDEVVDQLRRLAAADAAVDRAKPKADRVAAALAGGKSLEEATQETGLTAFKIEGTTRLRPDPRIAGCPELIGALFAARTGQVVGPFRSLSGWAFGRLDEITSPDSTMFFQVKAQLSNELLQNRQQTFFSNYLASLRSRAKVQDLRSAFE